MQNILSAFESFWGSGEPAMLVTLLPMFILTKVLIPYLAGSIPFGYLLTKFSGKGDIRDIGSGNIGATNVLRTGSKKLAILTLLGDFFKGWIVVTVYVYMGRSEGHSLMYYLMIMIPILIGHMFPVWLNFKGGKGVATYAGILVAFSPALGGIAVGIWILTLVILKYSSLAALISTLAVPFVGWLLPLSNATHREDPQTQFIYLSFMTMLVWWRHKDNIQRLLKGTEPKVGKK